MMYGTVVEADAYHAARGTEEWSAASPTAREQALTRATDYIEATYGHLAGVAPDDIFQKATFVASIYEVRQPGFFSVTSHPDSARKVLVGVDTLKWEIVGGSGGEEGYRPSSSLIDSMFARYRGFGPYFGLAMFTV